VLLLVAGFFLAGCGYHNPYAGHQPGEHSRRLHMAIWANQSSELGLEVDFPRALNDWFIKSGRLALEDDPAQADLVLSGRVLAADFPGLTYGAFDRAVEVRAVVTLWVELREKATGRVVWQEPGLTMEEPYLVGVDSVTTLRNRQRALRKIADELAEKIYYQALAALFAPTAPTGQPDRIDSTPPAS